MQNIITVENEWQDIHVHAPGCGHINRSVAALAGADVMEWPSEEHAAVFFFGEPAADHHDWGTPEWSELVRREWKLAARRFGCVSKV